MIKLSSTMTYNGQHYKLLKRSDKLAVFSIEGGRRYEVSRIYILPAESIMNLMYREREAISNHKQFGRDGSRYCNDLNAALKYFDKLNRMIGGVLEGEISDMDNGYSIDCVSELTDLSQDVNSENTSSNDSQTLPMKKEFRKNGYNYKMLMRDANTIMFSLSESDEICGYEVCRIHLKPVQEKFGKKYPSREKLPSDNEFGTEKSKTFLPQEYARAVQYFSHLTSLLLNETVFVCK